MPNQNNEPSENSLLTEYQVCQHDNSYTSVSYWTLAGIFIGISSALLAGLIYGVLANNDLFQIFGQAITTISATRQIWMLRIIILILGIGIIWMLCCLWHWLKRVRLLQQINYRRMREIELELGMWKSWRVHAIDEWQEMRKSKPCDNKIWSILVNKLKENLDTRHSELLEKRKETLVELVKRPYPEYERPTSKGVFKWILWVMISFWMILILIVWLLPLIMDGLNKMG
jgi:hypothetical protein